MGNWKGIPDPNNDDTPTQKLHGCLQSGLIGTLNKNKLNIWNVDTRKFEYSFDVKTEEKKQVKQLMDFEFSADGKWLAINRIFLKSVKNTIEIYSTSSWKKIRTIKIAPWEFGFSPSGQYFYISIGSTINIYDTSNFRNQPKTLGGVGDYCFLFDETVEEMLKEKIFITNSDTQKLYNLVTNTYAEIKNDSFVFSPNGRFLISGPKKCTSSNKLKEYLIEDIFDKIKPFSVKTTDDKLPLTFSPDGTHYALLDKGLKTLEIFSISGTSEYKETLTEDCQTVSYGFSPRSKFFWIYRQDSCSLELRSVDNLNVADPFKNVIFFNFYMNDDMLVVKDNNDNEQIKIFINK